MNQIKLLMANRLARHSMLKLACAVVATVLAGSAIAQQAPKGPVWLNMDQKEIDDAYDQSVWAPNQQHISKRRDLAIERTLARISPPERVAYGPTEIEKLDIYKTKGENAPIQVFIHGGAWRSGSARGSTSYAEMFVNAGAHYVALDF